MNRFLWIPALVLTLLVTILCWDPILDFLPIDQSGWIVTEQGESYLGEDGNPVSGWQEIEGTTYYFHPETFTLYTGWAQRGSLRCYVSEGLACSGWTDTPEGRFYLKEDGSIYTGWLEEDGKRIYLNKEGLPATGWTDTNEGRFYLDSHGAPCTGVVKTDKGLYCFGPDGALSSGWYEQDGKRYFAKEDGSLHLGWLELDGKTYYMREDGSAARGKLVIDDQACFFSSSGEQFILVNPWHELPKDFSANLEAMEGCHGDPVCKDDLKAMFSDCRAAGLRPRIMSGHRSVSDQTINFQRGIWKYTARGYTYTAAYDIVRQIIAVPGTSEHHLGLAFDIVDAHHPYLETSQENTETQKWLMEHSWEYGFIMRYPNGTTEITGIIYEPWHYRYVGREMAAEIHELGITLEEYVDMLTADGTTCGGTVTSEEK